MTLAEWLEVLPTADDAALGAFCDWCEENGDDAEQLRRMLTAHRGEKGPIKWKPDLAATVNFFIEGAQEMLAPKGMRGYSWKEAFAFAGKETGCNQSIPERALPNDADTSVEPFGRLDIAEVLAFEEGANDSENWLVAGRLKDGRWFFLDAGCDYTGWD